MKNYYGYTFNIISACQCSEKGSEDSTCDENGKCYCKPHVVGDLCTECAIGYSEFPECDKCTAESYGFPDCQPCSCNEGGSLDNSCDVGTGKCTCLPNVVGDKCDKCGPGFFGFPNCQGKLNENK